MAGLRSVSAARAREHERLCGYGMQKKIKKTYKYIIYKCIMNRLYKLYINIYYIEHIKLIRLYIYI